MILTAVAPAEAIIGIWYNTDKSGKIEIYKKDGSYFGKIVWLQDPLDENGEVAKDKNNPDKSMHTTPLIGLIVMHDFSKDSDGEFKGGNIYDPENGKTYKCKLKLRGDELDVRGYIGIPTFGRTETWTRVE
ncbi:MAG: DUF2147 domain-containing protein [Chitinophagales bacterium]|nr:DUF2147 domain-containing protein [Chitinophagales bacterium]